MSLEDIRQCYAKATRTWTGCDWATQFGSARLNLKGLTPGDAELRAQQEAAAKEDWLAAARWLTEIEQSAERAEVQAALALAAANAGDLDTALEHADAAWSLEEATGRTAGASSPAWSELRQLIAAAVRNRGSAGRAAPLAHELRALARTLDQLARRVQELETATMRG